MKKVLYLQGLKKTVIYFQIAAASRIPGMTPAAILTLLRYIRKNMPKTTTLEPS